MDSFEISLFNSIDNYYKHITNTGYAPYNNVEALLILMFYEEIFNSDMAYLITDEDLLNINRAVFCLRSTFCNIDIPEAISEVYVNDSQDSLSTLQSILRSEEDIVIKSNNGYVIRSSYTAG